MSMPESPLTEQHLQSLNEAQASLTRLDEMIRRAKQAGLDVTAFESQARETRERILRLKQAFFPGR